jgi:hypothetical protein
MFKTAEEVFHIYKIASEGYASIPGATDDDYWEAYRLAEHSLHGAQSPADLASRVREGLLEKPVHPKDLGRVLPTFTGLGALGGSVAGAYGAGHLLTKGHPRAALGAFAAGLTGGAALGAYGGHKFDKFFAGSGGDERHQKALQNRERRLQNIDMVHRLANEAAEEWWEPNPKYQ